MMEEEVRTPATAACEEGAHSIAARAFGAQLPPDQSVLLFGASGFLGRAFAASLVRQGVPMVAAGWNAAAAHELKLDLCEPGVAMAAMERCCAGVVIYCAALADVDACEREPALSHAVNLDAPRELAAAAAGKGVLLAYISTDYVFAGLCGPYAENDETGPVNVYGLHKAQAEQAVLELAPNSLVLRTSQLYDAASCRRSLTCTSGGPLILSDQRMNTPTHVQDVVDGTLALLGQHKAGIYHLAGPETLSRFAAGLVLVRTLASDLRIEVGEGTPHGAPRPLRCGLCVDKARAEIGYAPRSLACVADAAS